MTTITLSANAVAVLRFEIRGWKGKDPARRLPAYRELAEAGIMEPVPGSETEYRFTRYGMEHREEILELESDRIESDRDEPPDASKLSAAAREFLRCLASGESLAVNEANKPLYRELAVARIMAPGHAFVGGWEAVFRFTYWGWRRRFEFAEVASAKEIA